MNPVDATPHCHIGVEPVGGFVLGVDPRTGGDETLEIAHGPLPLSPRAQTGGGVQHISYRLPIPTRLQATLGPGIDAAKQAKGGRSAAKSRHRGSK